MKSKSKILTRSLALLLAVLIGFYAIPSTVFAAFGGKENPTDATIEAAAEESHGTTDTREIYEVTDSRRESVKLFKMPDGSYTAAQYTTAVHRLDSEGKWQDIDNTLKDSGSEFLTSDARIKFAKKITGNETLFTLHENNKKITFSLNGAEKKTVGEIQSLKESEPADELSKLTTLENLSSSIIYRNILEGIDLEYVVYGNDIKENIIIKEKSDSYTYSFTVKLNNLSAELLANGSVVFLDYNGAVSYFIPAPIVYDANGTYAEGSISAYTLKDNGNGSYSLSVSISAEWMNDESRAYPVTLDPTVSTPSDSGIEDMYIDGAYSNHKFNYDTLIASNTQTAYIKFADLSFLPPNAYISEATLSLYVRQVSSPGLIGAFRVTSAWEEGDSDASIAADGEGEVYINSLSYYNVWTSSIGKKVDFDITQALSMWNMNSVFNHGIALKALLENEEASISFKSSEFQDSNTPSLTVKFKNISGIESYLSYSSHSIGDYLTGSVNLATGNLVVTAPTLTTTDSIISYTPTLFFNSVMANAFNCGTNSQSAFDVSATGVGFKWSMRQSVIKKNYVNNGETVEYYVFLDADGTEHAFYEYSEDVYMDEEGLNFRLSFDGNNAEISDTSHNTMIFEKVTSEVNGTLDAWRLTAIKDNYDNRVAFEFNQLWQPTAVKFKPCGEAEIYMLYIEYGSGGSPAFIYNPRSHEGVIFRYSRQYNGIISNSYGWYLREIEYCQGTASATRSDFASYAANSGKNNLNTLAKYQISYTSSGLISSIKETLSNYSVSYTYNGNKISQLSEKVGENDGQRLGFTYKTQYTEIRNSGADDIYNNEDDISNRYSFDREGRTVASYSYELSSGKVLGASSGIYVEEGLAKNKIKESGSIGGSAVNYLLNGNFELITGSNFDYWIKTANVSKSVSYEADSYNRAYFKIRAGQTESIKQYVYLPAGDYTLSFDISSYMTEGAELKVDLKSIYSSGGINLSKKISMDKANESNIRRVSVSFSVNNVNESGGDKIELSISTVASMNVSSSASLTVDKVMLEEGIGASSFSLVSMGSFEKTSIKADGSTNVLQRNVWETEGSTALLSPFPAPNGFGVAMGISGGMETKYLKQRAYEAPYQLIQDYNYGYYTNEANESYIVSGYGRSFAAIGSLNSKFALRVDVAYYQGDEDRDGVIDSNELEVVTHRFDFSADCTTWQFVSGMFSTKVEDDGTGVDYSLVAWIDVICEYSFQPNTYAYFDNISLVNCSGEKSEKYTYHENGLLKSAKNYFYEEFYGYDDNNNLEFYVNTLGDLIKYSYNSNNALDEEITFTFTLPYGANSDPFNEAFWGSITKTRKLKKEYTYDAYGQCIGTLTYSYDDGKTISNSMTYSDDNGIFGALTSETDSLGRVTLYFYDETNGALLAYVNPASGDGMSFSYDSKGFLSSVRPAEYVAEQGNYSKIFNEEYTSYSYNSQTNALSEITTDTTRYVFSYDAFGNTSSISIGNGRIVSYEYNSYNGKLKSLEYENGLKEDYVYNTLDLISEIWYTKNNVRSLAYSYSYTAKGQIYRVDNHITGRSTVYSYDTGGRLSDFVEFDTDTLGNDFGGEITYDQKGFINYVKYSLACDGSTSTYDKTVKYSHSYDTEGKIVELSVNTGTQNGDINYTYDIFGRISVKTSSFGNFSSSEHYIYRENDRRSSYEIAGFTSTVNGNTTSYSFTYDANGNIICIDYGNGVEVRYEYDSLGQLVFEDNELLDATFIYYYDDAGNLTKKNVTRIDTNDPLRPEVSENYIYSYTNASWGDLLTSYGGVTISYDEIGNPINYYNGSYYTFAWEGRQLVSAQTATYNVSFEYNENGIRTSKTVNGVKTEYYLDGNKIMAEKTGGNITVYVYDESGQVIGMQYHAASAANNSWEVFWFEKNLQGDIVGVYNSFGTKLISYAYDAWGNITVSYSNGGASSAAAKNPFRYRGYYYDTELGLYYVSSRYYDSAISRWISPEPNVYTGKFDGGSGLIGSNLYAYCANNPVNFSDPTGEFLLTAIVVGAVAGAIIGGTVSYNSGRSSGLDGADLFWSTVAGAGKGALIGAAAGGIVGVTGSAIAAYGATSNAATAMITATATVTSKATEVVMLQSKKSANDGDDGWQIANDCIDSIFYNTERIFGPACTKMGMTGSMYLINKFSTSKIVRHGYNKYLGKFSDPTLSYFLAAYSWGETVYSAMCSDPIARANQKGYILK